MTSVLNFLSRNYKFNKLILSIFRKDSEVQKIYLLQTLTQWKSVLEKEDDVLIIELIIESIPF